jgi:PAS domain S-box-containing protein
VSWVAGALTLPRDAFATFRPPNAFLIALALLDRPERWWIYALATVPGNPTLYNPNTSWLATTGYALANIVEVTLGLGLLRHVLGRTPRFARLMDCAAFVVGVAIVAPLASAAVGAGAAVLERSSRSFWAIWRNWFFADALAYVALTPALLLAAQGRWRVTKARRWEAAALVTGVVGVAALALDGQLGQVNTFPALVYAPLPFLIWAAVRFGPTENSLAMLTLAGVVLVTALSGRGAFQGLSTADSALSMQLLLFMLAVPQMFLAAIVDEHRQAEERFRTAFRATPDVIALTTRQDGVLIDVNESFERTSGYSREEALGRTVTELGLWTDPSARAKYVERLTLDGRVRDFPVTTTSRDGTISHGLLSAEPIELDGVDALITVRRDVTDQVKAADERSRFEAQIQQARKMEAIGQLAGGIAHDFNNLLQAIKGYTELAAGALVGDHRAAPALQQVLRASERATSLTTQLLTFSRREALKPEALDVNAVVGDTAKILHRLLGDHIQLLVVDGPALPAIHADRSQLEQIVMNLCINARDAMPDGGIVTLETGFADFTEEECRDRAWARPGRWVFVRVGDEGSGIPDEILPHVFEPFYTTKAVGRGTGLGLATVYAIVERHRGLIAIDTAPDMGTTVTIYFPATIEAARAAGATDSADDTVRRGRGETILVAEDEPFVRDLVVEMLQDAGYRVLVACDGAEADALVRERAAEVDAAVLDIAMPFRSGRQVFETIQEVRPQLPVVFSSGYSFGELTDAASLTGTVVLTKPYNRTTLLNAVRAALEPRSKTPTSQVGF